MCGSIPIAKVLEDHDLENICRMIILGMVTPTYIMAEKYSTRCAEYDIKVISVLTSIKYVVRACENN